MSGRGFRLRDNGVTVEVDVDDVTVRFGDGPACTTNGEGLTGGEERRLVEDAAVHLIRQVDSRLVALGRAVPFANLKWVEMSHKGKW